MTIKCISRISTKDNMDSEVKISIDESFIAITSSRADLYFSLDEARDLQKALSVAIDELVAAFNPVPTGG